MPHAAQPPTVEPGERSGPGRAEQVTTTTTHDVQVPGLGRVAMVVLTPQDPARPPTLGPIGLTRLREVLTALQGRAAAGELVAVVVTGSGRHLAAGADLHQAARVTTRAEALETGRRGHATYRLLAELGVPTLAVINGTALGGGLELALHCTYRAVGADVTALGLPETSLGLVPGWGGCTLLPALVGMQHAVELVVDRPLTGNRLTDASEAAALGLVDVVLDPDRLLDQALAWWTEVLAGRLVVPRPGPEPAEKVRSILDAARARVDRRLHGAAPAPYRALDLLATAPADRDAGFAAEDEALADLLLGPELRASLYAFDLTRAARRPIGTAQPTVREVGVVGAGLMATQLAVLVARRLAVPVRMREVDQERAQAGRERVAHLVDQLRRRGTITDAQADHLLASVTVGTDLADLAGADLVVEAVTEVLAVKQQVFAQLEDVVGPQALLATNTSALSIAAMSTGLRYPGRVVGLHVFNPVERMPLIEVVRAVATDDSTVATARGIAVALGKSPVTVADRPGFVVNRLLLRLLAEVLACVRDGTDVRVADAALRPMGLPMGPFALLQLVGLPVALHVLDSLRAELGERYARSPGLERLAAQGRRVVGPRGSGTEDAVDPQIQEAFGPAGGPGAPEEHEVRDRVLAALAAEVGLMLDEEVVAGPGAIDVAMVLGAGWPLHLGGICPYLDRTGWSQRVLGRRLLAAGVADLPAFTGRPGVSGP